MLLYACIRPMLQNVSISSCPSNSPIVFTRNNNGLRALRIGIYRGYRSRPWVYLPILILRLKTLVYCDPRIRVFHCRPISALAWQGQTNETFIITIILYYYCYNIMHKRAPPRLNETLTKNFTYFIRHSEEIMRNKVTYIVKSTHIETGVWTFSFTVCRRRQ